MEHVCEQYVQHEDGTETQCEQSGVFLDSWFMDHYEIIRWLCVDCFNWASDVRNNDKFSRPLTEVRVADR
jgi:hypothetical protein